MPLQVQFTYKQGQSVCGKVVLVTVHERILVIRLLEQQEKNPEYLKRLGVHIEINKVETTCKERRKCIV